MRDTEAARKLGTVPIVSIEQLDDTRGLAGGADPVLDAVAGDRIDQPDATVDDEGMRAALHELVDDPPEAGVELVADAHSAELTDTP